MTTLFLSFIFLQVVCINNGPPGRHERPDNIAFSAPEHFIKKNKQIKNDSTILYTGWYFIVETDSGIKRQLDKSTRIYSIHPKAIVTAKNFTRLEIYESNAGGQKYLGLSMQLDKEGTKNWSMATEKTIGRHLAFILDNRLLQVAKVNSQITAGMTALNRGDYTRQELENFRTIIERESK